MKPDALIHEAGPNVPPHEFNLAWRIGGFTLVLVLITIGSHFVGVAARNRARQMWAISSNTVSPDGGSRFWGNNCGQDSKDDGFEARTAGWIHVSGRGVGKVGHWPCSATTCRASAESPSSRPT